MFITLAGCGAGSSLSGSPPLWNNPQYDIFLPQNTGGPQARATVTKDGEIAGAGLDYHFAGQSSSPTEIVGRRTLMFAIGEAIMVCPQTIGSAAEAILLSPRFDGGSDSNSNSTLVQVTNPADLKNMELSRYEACGAQPTARVSFDAIGVISPAQGNPLGKSAQDILADSHFAVYKRS